MYVSNKDPETPLFVSEQGLVQAQISKRVFEQAIKEHTPEATRERKERERQDKLLKVAQELAEQ